MRASGSLSSEPNGEAEIAARADGPPAGLPRYAGELNACRTCEPSLPCPPGTIALVLFTMALSISQVIHGSG